jgi:hypothetical protein|nr:MAG TPA: ATPase [Caudoviricetes sp.]
MLGLYVVIAVVVLGLVIGVSTSVVFEKSLIRRKREEEDARIREELSKQEQKCAPKMEQEERQSTAQSDDEEKLKLWYANMNMNLNDVAVDCGFNMLQLYFASVNGTTKTFKDKLNKLTRLNRYYK